MALKRPQRAALAEKVMKRFVEIVRELPQVTLVFVSDDTDEGPRIWTVIDAPRFEEGPRNQVYAAKYEALGDTLEPPFGFRVVNIQELAQPLEHVISPIDRLLFDRRTAG